MATEAEHQLSELLEKHFDDHQLDEDALSYCATNRAEAIKKKISVIALNSGIENLTLKGQNSSNRGIDDILQSIFLHYVDKLVAENVTSANREQVEKLMELVSALVSIFTEELAEAVVSRVIHFSTVLLERVRGQASTFIGYLATHIAKNQEEWAQEWFEALKDAILPRLTDKSQSVRNSALRASTNFFRSACDESGTEDLLDALLWNLWHDPSVTNRNAALEVLPITNETVDHVVARIRDVKEKVRVQALLILKDKVDPCSHMTPDYFAEVIRSGLSDRCEATKEATKKLICSKWMKAAKFDPVKLLKLIGVVVNEEECEKAMNIVLEIGRSQETSSYFFNDLSDPEIRAFQSGIAIDKSIAQAFNTSTPLDADQLFFARIACSTARESNMLSPAEKYDILNNASPDIPVLCDVLKTYVFRLAQALQKGDPQQEDKNCFLCLQLLQLGRVARLNEEGSRRHFSSYLRGLLSSPKTPDDIVEGCIESLRATYGEETEFLKAISTIISHISSTEDICNDDESLSMLRILSIMTIVFEIASPGDLGDDLIQDVVPSMIISAVTNQNVLVREAGVSCLGKLGLFVDKERVTEFKHILLEVASNEKEKVEIRSQALLALSDWSLLFEEILHPCNIQNQKMSLLDVVETMIQHENSSVVAIAAEVSIKLLFSNRVCESSLVARLLVLFFDPNQAEKSHRGGVDTEEVGSMIRLQQLLSLFFTAYCIKSEYGRCATLVSLEFALGLAFHKKPDKASKKRIAFPLLKMIEFVSSTVETGKAASEKSLPSTTTNTSGTGVDLNTTSTTPLSVSIQVVKFLIAEEAALPVTQLRALCKFLGCQDIYGSDITSLCCFANLMEELGMVVVDDSSLRSLSFLNEKLSEIDREMVDGDNQNSSNDSCEDTVTEDGNGAVYENDRATNSGDSTVEDSLMNSMATLTVRNKENIRKSGHLKSMRSRNADQNSDTGFQEITNAGRDL